jgi:hypothetical protein
MKRGKKTRARRRVNRNPNPPSKKGIPSTASKVITDVLRHWTPALKDNAAVFFTLDGLAAAEGVDLSKQISATSI